MSQTPSTDDDYRRVTADPLLLVSEADHRIANSLALVSGLIRTKAAALLRGPGTVFAQDVAEILLEAAGQIETVARLSRLMSRHPGEDLISMAEHLREVCAMLSEIHAATSAMSIASRSTTTCMLGQEKVLPLSLIVNEVVTNAVKYAHPSGVAGRVDVFFDSPDGVRAVLVIADDGVGFPEGFDPVLQGGLGFRVIRALCEQLGGVHRFESGPLGVVFRLEMPA